MNIADYRDCSTDGCRGLDLQLIAQIQRIAPGVLVSFSHLNVVCRPATHPYLQASAVRSLEQAIASRGIPMHINSAYRTLAQQAVLRTHFQRSRCGITAAAIPGGSNHNSGLALDPEDPRGWRPYLEKFGWDWLGSWDPMHFDFKGSGSKDLKWLSVKAFQQLYNFNCLVKHRITEDGQWGPATEFALASTSSAGFRQVPDSTNSREIIVASHAHNKNLSLREGMIGTDVFKLKLALRSKGVPAGEGEIFSSLTTAAVKSFQLKNGLVPDGVVGTMTWGKLLT